MDDICLDDGEAKAWLSLPTLNKSLISADLADLFKVPRETLFWTVERRMAKDRKYVITWMASDNAILQQELVQKPDVEEALYFAWDRADLDGETPAVKDATQVTILLDRSTGDAV